MSPTLKEKQFEIMQDNMNKIHPIDCLEFMKQVPDDYFDLVLTDPPYGIDLANMNMGTGKSPKASRIENRKWKAKSWDKETPSDEIFDEIFRISKNQIIWGGNYFNLPSHKFYILWDKQIPNGLSFADCEMAWTSYDKAPRIFRYSAYRDKASKIHPTQKPLMLFEYCINLTKDIKTVFDPFMGSGTTAVACKSLGIDWCGCELEADYVEIANKRLEQVQGSLF
ncbi:MAG: site-specific DNA-methyltransferase [Sulfurovum sp.]|nr:MAG: site-specific DNA-methyltransferase [Sulfurovum sp.]